MPICIQVGLVVHSLFMCVWWRDGEMAIWDRVNNSTSNQHQHSRIANYKHIYYGSNDDDVNWIFSPLVRVRSTHNEIGDWRARALEHACDNTNSVTALRRLHAPSKRPWCSVLFTWIHSLASVSSLTSVWCRGQHNGHTMLTLKLVRLSRHQRRCTMCT